MVGPNSIFNDLQEGEQDLQGVDGGNIGNLSNIGQDEQEAEGLIQNKLPDGAWEQDLQTAESDLQSGDGMGALESEAENAL